MDSRVAAELIPPVYEDFDPSSDMVHEKEFDTILINLPGFRKDHLKVQLTTSKILRVSGSRLAENNKWRRFQKEFPVTPGRDPQRISAKFEGGILYIKVPMMIPTTPTPAMKKEEKENKQINKSPVTPPPEKLPSDDQQKPAQKKDSNTNAKVEELPREKKEEKSPEDKKSNISAGGDDNNKQEEKEKGKKSPEDQKNTSDEKPEGDNKKAKNQPDEEKTRDLDDIKEKKSVAEGEKDKKLDKKAIDDNKRDKDNDETTTNRVDENENLASKLKKHRRMFNLALVTILAIAIGIYVSDLFKSLRRRIQN